MRTTSELRPALGEQLAAARARLAAGPTAEATIILLPRSGYGTTRTTLESIADNTRRSHRIVAVDIMAPGPARAYLRERAAADPGFVHLQIDEYVSRQTARLLALELVGSEHVVFMDNNMLLEPGWLGALLDACRETGAAMVSPLIVMHGGEIHFSAGYVRNPGRHVTRDHFQVAGPVGRDYRECELARVDIDFAESHCCLARTAAMRIPGVLKEALHNAQTLCYAAYKLRTVHGQRIVLEPGAVAAIVPIGFGYDLDWICRSYLQPHLLEGSYGELTQLMGKGPSNDLEPSLRWHGMNVRYLLATMAHEGRMTSQSLLTREQLPPAVEGYDRPPSGQIARDIEQHVLPHLRRERPELEPLLRRWL